MEIEQWPIDRPKPYGRNPRVISDAAIGKVASSIKSFGFRQPIVVDEKGVIIAGHTRWNAARKIGLDTVPVHVAKGLSPEKIKAYRLADNRTSEESQWDQDLLIDEMTALHDDGFKLAHTGFNPEEIAKMFGIDLDEQKEEPAAVDAGDRFLLLLEFQGEQEQQAMFAELQERGVECKIMN